MLAVDGFAGFGLGWSASKHVFEINISLLLLKIINNRKSKKVIFPFSGFFGLSFAEMSFKNR